MRLPAVAVRPFALVGLAILVILAAGCGDEPTAASPGAAPQFECLGVPAPMCDQILREHAANRPVVAASIRCTAAVCSEAQGEVAITIVLAGGERIESGYGWAQAAPALPGAPITPPALPVPPTCIGIGERECLDRAADALSPLEDTTDIVSITVRCSGVCTPEKGSGETVITRVDGARDETQWEYASQ